MTRKSRARKRRSGSLSRDRIVEASIVLLDKHGEAGLTFRSLAARLSTGAGAIYWHVASKDELLTAACDTIVARTLTATPAGAMPNDAIRALALSLFDTIDDHPWVGTALTQAPDQLPMVRILESVGQQIRALGVREADQWSTVGALLGYILGVGGRNAANRQFGLQHGLDRSDYLQSVSAAWSQLDPATYPFTRSLAGRVREHDDREDFLAGIDLILGGIK